MKDESSELPHVRPQPTAADRQYDKQRDELMERAARGLAKADRVARESRQRQRVR